jgi:hypothetical protein
LNVRAERARNLLFNGMEHGKLRVYRRVRQISYSGALLVRP